MEMDFAMMPTMPDFEYQIFDIDSIPGYTFRLRSPADWEQFESDFKEKFKSQFKDFYDKNQKQFDKMLDEMKRNEIARRRDAAQVVDLERVTHKQAMNDAMIAVEMARHNQVLAEQQRSLDVIQYKEAEQLSKELSKMAAKQDMHVLRQNAQVLDEMYQKQAGEYQNRRASMKGKRATWPVRRTNSRKLWQNNLLQMDI
ncbi:MAG: hypothetical protein WDO15_16430 [Bacteroidota bacterium]